VLANINDLEIGISFYLFLHIGAVRTGLHDIHLNHNLSVLMKLIVNRQMLCPMIFACKLPYIRMFFRKPNGRLEDHNSRCHTPDSPLFGANATWRGCRNGYQPLSNRCPVHDKGPHTRQRIAWPNRAHVPAKQWPNDG